MKSPLRRLALPLLLVAVTAGVQGCFPFVAGGMTAGALMMADRRSSGTYVEDEGIELKIGNRISEQLGDQVHVNVTSYNRKALLTGEVPSAEIKDKVGQIAAEVPNVTGIHNELQVAGISSFSARSSDTLITSKVKARFVDGKRFSANWVKVTTEAGAVYLMGLVTQQEADDAIELARTTSGVTKVVNLMEIISYAQAKELGTRSNDNPGVPSPNNTAR